jgi:hypothetical protein
MTDMNPVLSLLVERMRHDHLAWINGDASGYRFSEEGSILGALGGHSMGGPGTSKIQAAVVRAWRRGDGTVEFVNGGFSTDLAWLTVIERASVYFYEEEVPTRWDLRATEVFRHTDGDWARVHRHADPLVDRRSVAEAAALLRNNGASSTTKR